MSDETAAVQDGHWVRGYASAGHTPVLVAAISQRFGLMMSSAISIKGLVRFEFLEGAATTETTCGFMQRLVQDSEGHKVFLIFDNLRVHHGKEVVPGCRHMSTNRDVLPTALRAAEQPA